MPNRFAAYGSLIASYEGTGKLRLVDGTSIPCEFEAAQLVSGQVMLRCIDPGNVAFPASSAECFIGRTQESYFVVARGLTWTIDLGRRLTYGQSRTITTYDCEQLTVTLEPGQDATPNYAYFGLTSLDLRRHERLLLNMDSPMSSGILKIVAEDNGHAVDILIKPLPRYQVRHRRIRALRVSEVTCELRLSVTPDHDLKYATDMARDISDLLSFTSGTPVNMVYRDLARDNGVRFFRNHIGAFPKRYVPYPLLDPRRPEDTRRFLLSAFPIYRRLKSQLNLREIVRSHLDAKQDADYLQVRGVKSAAVAEMLKASFVASGLLDIQEVRIAPAVFNKLVAGRLKNELNSAAEADEISQEIRQAFVQKIGDINRRDFREILAAICRYVQLDAVDDLGPFVRSRNRLIHTGHFVTEGTAAYDRELADARGWSKPMAEYFFMVDLIDRILLRLFEYEGLYVDISTWPSMVGKSLTAAPARS